MGVELKTQIRTNAHGSTQGADRDLIRHIADKYKISESEFDPWYRYDTQVAVWNQRVNAHFYRLMVSPKVYVAEQERARESQGKVPWSEIKRQQVIAVAEDTRRIIMEDYGRSDESYPALASRLLGESGTRRELGLPERLASLSWLPRKPKAPSAHDERNRRSGITEEQRQRNAEEWAGAL